MQTISFERSGFAQAVIVSLVTFSALVLLSLVLAHWTWAWLAPRPEPRAPEAPQTGGRAKVSYGLFGGAPLVIKGAATTGVAVRLLGIVAATGGRGGYALVQLDATQILAVREGENVAPGIRLTEVRTDHVTLDRGGISETLAWPGKNTAFEATPLRANQ